MHSKVCDEVNLVQRRCRPVISNRRSRYGRADIVERSSYAGIVGVSPASSDRQYARETDAVWKN